MAKTAGTSKKSPSWEIQAQLDQNQSQEMATQKMIAEEEHIAQYGEREVVGETHKDKKTLNVAVTMDESKIRTSLSK